MFNENGNLSFPARCAIFCGSPVRKLSMPITEFPSASNNSHKCDPKNPAAPVTSIFMVFPYFQSKNEINPSPVIWETVRFEIFKNQILP